MAAIQDTLSRADALLRERVRREEAALEREDAESMMAERERVRNDSHRCYQISERYADAFESFGVRPPAPIDGERPGQYRARLFESLRLRLPSDSEWSGVRADSVPASARDQIELIVIAAAKKEGLTPSMSSLPASGEVTRLRTDPETGAKATEFYSRSSFIRDMGRPGRRVVRLLDPRSRTVIWGEPLERFG